MQENTTQEIAANSAASTSQDFINSLPPEVSQALSPSYLHSLEMELQAELRSVILSRLQWFQQAIRLEQQQHQAVQSSLIPNSDLDPILQPEFLQKPSARADLLAELKSGVEPLPVASAADRSSRRHVVTGNPNAQDQMPEPTSQVPTPDLGSPTLLSTNQTEQPNPAELATSKPSLRQRRKEPQPTPEEILKECNIDPELLNSSHDPEVKPRRRRRRSPALA